MTRAHLRMHGVALQAHVFRYPIANPVQTSFGSMRERPAVLVRARDEDGVCGWGEVWCNFPACGAEHRARLVETVLAPLVARGDFASPAEAHERLTADTAVLCIQSGEAGPFAQAIAGVDLALWDLAARRARQPLWRILGGHDDAIAVYASGINPTHPERLVEARRNDGYRAFKLKVGFGRDRDLRNLESVFAAAGPDTQIMVDANQAWDFSTAREMLRALESFPLQWIEEPLRADRPWPEWRELRGYSPAPFAAGENVAGLGRFQALLESQAVDIVQPDVAKWGGHTACGPLARAIQAAGRRYVPHYLGAGIGLLHSAHLLAATGGGPLEVDANDNPLRGMLCGPINEVSGGTVRLGSQPGIGVDPDLSSLPTGC